MKKAMVTGLTGQDGSYLGELLLNKGYEVHGIVRRSSGFNTQRIDHYYVDPHTHGARLFLHFGDLTDAEQISNMIYNIRPDEIYNLGAQSHVRVSFDIPEYTGNTVALGTARMLEAIRRSGQKIKFYQASSSEMFGSSIPPQSEESVFQPRSPYACAKLYAYWMVKNYREGFNIFASNGILFNHESPRRGETFVTRKITRALANIVSGKQDKLFLGNLDAKRDWGYAPEYVEMMWMMLQYEKPDDFVVGTGQNHSVREFVEQAFFYAGITVDWNGKNEKEKGIIKAIDNSRVTNRNLKIGSSVIEVDPRYFRPTEVENLIANTEKAKSLLKWEPKITFRDLVKIMVDSDMKLFGLKAKGESDNILLEKLKNKWWSAD